METALILNCCSRWAKQCLIWNKCYAIDSDHAGAGSGWEKPSWEPSPGLEKSTPKLLGRSSLQGKHPWPRDLAVLSLKQHQNKKKKVKFLWVRGGESVISFLFSFFGGDGLALLHCPVPQPWPETSLKNWWGVTSAALPCCCSRCLTRLTCFLSVLFLPRREGISSRPMLLGKTLCNSICRAVCEF